MRLSGSYSATNRCSLSVTEPGLEAAAAQAPNALKIFQLYVRGDNEWVDE